MDNQKEPTNPVFSHLSSKDDIKPRTTGDLSDEKATIEDIKREMNIRKEDITVHAMPGKFVNQGHDKSSGSSSGKTKKKMSNSQKIMIISIILFVIIIVVVAGGLWFISQNRANTNTNVNQNVNTNTNQNSNTNTNTNANQNTNQNTNTNVNQNTNSNQNINNNSNVSVVTPENIDVDDDGLSYEEEATYSTNVNLKDTDRDGFSDGQEIINLYNPLLPNQKLVDSSLVTVFVNNMYGYSFYRPSKWLADTVDGALDQVNIIPDSESGESFLISVVPNEGQLTLDQAFNEYTSILGQKSDYQNYSLAGQPAYRSLDGTKVISVNDKFIYLITYDLGLDQDLNYFNTSFEMMLNSFTWLQNDN